MFYIDRHSPVPVYYQVMTDLKRRIRDEEWKENEKLPAEQLLADYYGISRITFRQAIVQLEKDGLLEKRKNLGTFVNKAKAPMLTRLSYSMSHNSTHFDTTIIDQNLIAHPDPIVLSKLELSENDSVVYVTRFFSNNGEPIAICKSYLPQKLVPGLEKKALVDSSLTHTLEKNYNLRPLYVIDHLQAIRSTQADSKLLRITLDTPLMMVEGLSFYAKEKPLEYSNTLWVGDSVQFEIKLDQNFNF